jgi:hypothetical protein
VGSRPARHPRGGGPVCDASRARALPTPIRPRDSGIGDGIAVQEHHRIGRTGIADVVNLEQVLAFSEHTGPKLDVELLRKLPVPASLPHPSSVDGYGHMVVRRFGEIASSLPPQLERPA